MPGGFRRLGRLEIDMRVSKSAVQKRAFPDGTASGLDADLKHRAPVGPLAKGDRALPCGHPELFSTSMRLVPPVNID